MADAAASQGPLDPVGALIVALAGLMSLSPLRMARAELAGASRVGWLGLALACALVRIAMPGALSLMVDAAHALGLVSAACLIADLALGVPDRFGSPARARTRRVLLYASGVVVALLAAAAQAPAFQAFGYGVIAPAWLAQLPAAALALALVGALALRLLRRRLSSSEEALASNAWGIFGLVPAVGVLGVALAARFGLDLGAEVLRAAIAGASGLLLWSHLRLVDPRRRLSVGLTTRNAVALSLALSISGAACVIALPFWPDGPLARGAGVIALLLFAAALHRGLRELSRVALAPASGRLLLALEQAHAELGAAHDLPGVARLALGAARAASGNMDAEPFLYLFDPILEFRIDAAGQAHAAPQLLHSTLLSALRSRPVEILLRAPLEAQIVRQPQLRPLIEALCGLDALCMLPLQQRGDLEGALLFPRGKRKSRLTLEEIEALQRFGRDLAGVLGVMCAEARATQRATASMLESKRLGIELTRAQDELTRLHGEVRALRAGEMLDGLPGPNVAYSAGMRAALDRLDRLAASAAPVLLVAERGIPLAPLAHLLHHAGGRGQRPFMVAECASVRPELSRDALFGQEDRPGDGWLKLAGDGTLLLCDLPALSLDAQRVLASALAAGGDRKPRIVAGCRRDPDLLVAEGALLPELRSCFSQCVVVPALRERVEDLPSLCLLALDRSARVLGRAPLGLEADAQARLLGYEWPGNVAELQSVIEQAVARARGPRVTLQDLAWLAPPAPAAAKETGHPLDGTLDRVERRVLRRALERTDGNKSEAARLLGLKRTTFLDRLRRHGLDDGQKPQPDEAEPN